MTEVLLDDERRAELAERLVPVASDLACRVRDADRDGVAEVLDALAAEEARALPVVLAAMVDVDRPIGELLAWSHAGAAGRPRREASPRRGTRGERPAAAADPVVAERAAAGEAVATTRADKIEAARVLADAGHGPSRIAKRLGVSGSTARTLYDQAAAARREASITGWTRLLRVVAARAACPGSGVDFHPDRDRLGEAAYAHAVDRAVEVCGSCPVLSTCRAYALARPEELGVWGGLSAEARHKLLDGVTDHHNEREVA